jgi:hypothetical protein
MPDQSVSIRLTPDGYTVTVTCTCTCTGTGTGTHVTRHGPTEAAAWNDFWTAYHAQWMPPHGHILQRSPAGTEAPAYPHPACTRPLRVNRHLAAAQPEDTRRTPADTPRTEAP